MPYDPRALQQMGRMGIGMMAPQPPPFQQPQQQQPPRRPPEWWEQPLPQRKDQPADQSADPSQDTDRPKRPPPPSLLEMMVDYHNKQRPRSEHAVQYGQPDGTVTASPWAFMGGMGSGGPPR
jgi:hypothetical protein